MGDKGDRIMVSVKWLVEKTWFNDTTKKLPDEIRKQGMQVKVIPLSKDGSIKTNLFRDNDCVVGYTSLRTAKQITRHAPWIPGIYCNLHDLSCDYYYPRMAPYLFNRHFYIIPFGNLQGNILFHFAEELFIRPMKGGKEFFAKTVSNVNDYVNEHQHLSPETLLLVSYKKQIKREWRLVVTDNGVLTGSRYSTDQVLGSTDDVVPPQEVIDFGNNVLSKIDFRPDPIWTLDICEGGSDLLYVLEANSFSCAGLYHSDLSLIVEEASKIALKDYEDINGF